MLKPEKLNINDQVAIVAPSQAAKAQTVNRAIKTISALNLKPIVYNSCYLIDDNTEVPDEIRANDINEAFRNPLIKGIISLKAGYGTLSILDYIDYETVRLNPKIFIGFSDITALHLAINKFSDLVTFHGPLASSNICKKGKSGLEFDEYTYDYLSKNIFDNKPLGILENPQNDELECLYEGNAKGKLTGGNLTILYETLGTKYEIDTKDKILFIEDMGESLTSISNMLHKLSDANKFADCNGVILGTWIRCAEEYSDENQRKLKMKEIFEENILKHHKPVISNLRAGHNIPMITLPLGINIELYAKEKVIKYVESANI